MNVRVRAGRLAEWRKVNGLTQRHLAQRLGVSTNYIAALEGGARDPGPKLRKPLMDMLGAGFFDLFDVVLIDDAGNEQLLAAPTVSAPDVSQPSENHH